MLWIELFPKLFGCSVWVDRWYGLYQKWLVHQVQIEFEK